ncbi:putative G1/S-specific cyclin [Colletotrichum godetiae]|uniref:G1/S-specific cyclin n=1 Tax=Colletotrichum godetiae TaxID=1209918 RepID=A0AAJ0EQQ8_9PEZI|nr:putative G1/S-specific cyclin [Colletotrichum godetiae]KAK1659792.1 putative G1/S-specific cyclin [Colletotrichum godetiae]
MRKVLKRDATELGSPDEVPIAKRQRLSLSRTHELNDEYSQDILKYMKHIEAQTMPDMSRFPAGIKEMRPDIVRYLQVAHAMLGLLPETLFLSVNIVDRFCCEQSFCGKAYYKLISCTALWIASKYIEEKGRVPSLPRLMWFISEGCYREKRLFFRLEMDILTELKWRVNHPTPYFFIQLLEMDDDNEAAVRELAVDICKANLANNELIGARLSVLARQCLLFAGDGSLGVNSQFGH